MVNGEESFSLFGNQLKRSQARRARRWQRMFERRFDYDPAEQYELSLEPNEQLGPIFGIENIVRGSHGRPIEYEDAIVCATVRMGFGHYRIAMAGASAAAAMGLTPYWLDLLAVPGITSEVINWWNTGYSRMSRRSQRSRLFNRYVWEPVTSGEKTVPGLSHLLHHSAYGWPWKFLKANARDYRMSELFGNLHRALPSDMPLLASHMWNCMGAVAGGMTSVVDMVFDNWPMAFQLTEGAMHGIQSPSGYYGFRTMRGFDESGRLLNPVPADALSYVGHHVDHELVENLEADCAGRLHRLAGGQPRRFLLTMGGAGAQRDLFKAIIEHFIPLVGAGEATLFVNLGDHASNWDWLQTELGSARRDVQTHFSWDDTRGFADSIRTGPASGIHVFLFDNTFHAVYSTNYLMRVADVLITKPSELAFYPIPKIFIERVGGHEAWGAIRSAEIGDGTSENRTVPETLQAIDLFTRESDLMRMYCEAIVRNKGIGIYDGAYRCVELASGRRWTRVDGVGMLAE